MSSYKRATLEEEEGSDTPAEAASSPDRVEVSEHTTQTNRSQASGGSCELPVEVLSGQTGASQGGSSAGGPSVGGLSAGGHSHQHRVVAGGLERRQALKTNKLSV